MGWIGRRDPFAHIRLRLPDRQSAIDFAERQGWPYVVQDPPVRRFRPKNYANNFRYDLADAILEEEAREQVPDVEVRFTDMSDWYTIERVGETHAAAKVLVENGSGRILGAHLLEPEASEVIDIFALAMRAGLHAADLKKLVSAYPSAGSDVVHLI